LTERLYYADSYLTSFHARVIETRPEGSRHRVYLDCTAFYPASGGQPHDLGRLGGVPVLEVVDEDDSIAHLVENQPPEGPVTGEIDWARRFDHMQQHTGQHLLSAVLAELFGFPTVSFHLGFEASTIDLATPELTPGQVTAAEARANQVVFENRPVTVRFCTPEEAAGMGLRKPSERQGPLRVVEIADCDRSACGGTHVRTTGEIGPILIRRLDRVRQTVRVEFLCGGRAVRRARADYEALARVAQLFSAPLDDTPALVAAQIEAGKAADKARQKLETEIAGYQGRELYRQTPGDDSGRRVCYRAERSGSIDRFRSLAQAYTAAGPGAVFLVTAETPPALLLAVSADTGLRAGEIIKSVAGALGGRGGGSATLAQGSLPDSARLAEAVRRVWESAGVS
jgi:alanyl-tRNA synthetase